MRENEKSASDLKTISAWDALRPRRRSQPANPVRYAHLFWFGLGVLALAIALTVAVIPARSVELDMRDEAITAKLQGFPDLPPGGGNSEAIADWRQEWRNSGLASLTHERTLDLSFRVGEYEDDSAVLNLAVMGSLLGLMILAGLGFGRALNNLYALGYGTSTLSPAWAFVSWLLPILSFVLPWRVVTEVLDCAWQKPDDDPATAPKWPLYLAGAWGLVFAALWILNPVSLNIFSPRGDIDEWISHITWTGRMLLWLPVPALLTGALLLVVAVRQHGRYRELDRMAAAARQRA